MNTRSVSSQSKFRGALLGTMVGDALGAPVEGWDCDRLNQTLDAYPFLNKPQQELSRAIFGLITGDDTEPGYARYTDDTQMTIGVAEALVECGGVDEAVMAHRFAENFERNRGYGLGAISVLSALRNGAPWREPAARLFGGRGSWGNGAAMRAAPIGLFYANHDAALLRDAALRSAVVTHAHPLGKAGAVMQAAAVAAATRLDPNEVFDPFAFLAEVRAMMGDELPEYRKAFDTITLLLRQEPAICAVASALGNGIEAHLSVPAALYAFLSHPDSFAEAVLYAVRLGGDADTIGAMCGAITGAFHGEEAIPTNWLAALENGRQGRDFLRSLADRLHAAAIPYTPA